MFPDEHAITFFLERTPDLLCIADTDGYFLYLNPAWQEALGYSLDELRARPFVDFVHPTDKDKTVAETGKVAGDASTRLFENRYMHRDGGIVWLSWNSVHDSHTDLIYAVARDITPLKEAEQGRLRLHQNIAHDMSAPVSAIRLFLAAQQRKQDIPEKARVFLSRNVERLTRLISDARDASRIQAGRLEISLNRVDLAELVSHVCQDLQSYAEDKDVDLQVDARRAVVEADPGRIAQVATNLVHNALKFSPAKGTVRVTCDSSDGHAEVCVADNGPGMSPADAERLFEPFTQLQNAQHASEKGTGLGLYISRELVAAHGGSIRVDATEGKGARFTFRLPLANAVPTEDVPRQQGFARELEGVASPSPSKARS